MPTGLSVEPPEATATGEPEVTSEKKTHDPFAAAAEKKEALVVSSVSKSGADSVETRASRIKAKQGVEKTQKGESRTSREKMSDLEVKEKEETDLSLKDFVIIFYMRHFRASDVSVKLVDRTLVIDASHKEHVDEHGFVSRSMLRKHNLPHDVLADKISCIFTNNGFLYIKGERTAQVE